MRVGFDISQLAHPGGVATYIQNLADQLQKIPELEMVYFYSSLRKPYTGKLKNVKQFRLPPTLFEIFFNRIRNIGIERFIGTIDVFHSSDWVQPSTKAKKVTTYYDVVPLKFPQWSHPKIVAVHKRRLKIVEQEIDKTIAISHATKKDLLEVSNIPADKIVVIYPAVSGQFKKLSDSEVKNFRKKYNLPEQFILGIGGVGERRNLKRARKAAKNYTLLITSSDLPFLPGEELPLLYNSATLLLYPSFYEGFGLPILEAQACGVPVITSNLSSMPEVAGEGAILVDPENEQQMEEVINQVMSDEKIREDLIRKGFINVKKFSWQRCARETADVYKTLV